MCEQSNFWNSIVIFWFLLRFVGSFMACTHFLFIVWAFPFGFYFFIFASLKCDNGQKTHVWTKFWLLELVLFYFCPLFSSLNSLFVTRCAFFSQNCLVKKTSVFEKCLIIFVQNLGSFKMCTCLFCLRLCFTISC